ncbi:MipA/OmpV family protein [Litorisediminicola beolgyonensis]|uniref:MipA/OmpV family protein n=1 Tax=Litorisediminicola beolgyonensis TaxID=1173614 RepID=A0ABW3ZP39_9RHOB
MLSLRLSLVALLAASPALAAGPEPVPAAPVMMPAPAAPATPNLVFSLRGGVATSPEYFGSDEYTLGPDFGLSVHYLRWGQRSFGDPDPQAVTSGFAPRGSFRYIAARDPEDHDALDGLDEVDAAVELGFGLGYTARNFEAFVDLRRGFGGHEDWVAEAGADAVFRPSPALRLSIGPRLLWAGDEYHETYFGVTEDEAAASDFAAYAPEGGVVSTGLAMGMTYRFNDVWSLDGEVTYDVFRGDAADSPIVQQGSEDQWGARIGITRVFSIGG